MNRKKNDPTQSGAPDSGFGINIILVGFMGSGKTIVGKLLADDLNLKFVDLDGEIEKSSGLLIGEIFKNHGEEYFRELEKKEIQNLKNIRNSVISLGGGSFCTPENINLLKAIGITVYLKADYSTLIHRYTEEEIIKRPLLQQAEKVQDLLKKREIYYSQADLIIDTNNMNPAEINKKILSNIRK